MEGKVYQWQWLLHLSVVSCQCHECICNLYFSDKNYPAVVLRKGSSVILFDFPFRLRKLDECSHKHCGSFKVVFSNLILQLFNGSFLFQLNFDNKKNPKEEIAEMLENSTLENVAGMSK